MKLQSLRCDFETLLLKNGKSITVFFLRVMAIVIQMVFMERKFQVKQLLQRCLEP